MKQQMLDYYKSKSLVHFLIVYLMLSLFKFLRHRKRDIEISETRYVMD
jgi:hypothetical protein